MADDNTSVQLVRNFIEASQRARASGNAADFAAVRGFLADEVVTRMASPWTDEPWQVKQQGADAMIERLQAPINTATSLTTENVNVQLAGEDVLVEQLSTIVDSKGKHVTMICHIFSLADGAITGIRAYRNDLGLPTGRSRP